LFDSAPATIHPCVDPRAVQAFFQIDSLSRALERG